LSRNVFKSRLKVESDGVDEAECGRASQARASETGNARSRSVPVLNSGWRVRSDAHGCPCVTTLGAVTWTCCDWSTDRANAGDKQSPDHAEPRRPRSGVPRPVRAVPLSRTLPVGTDNADDGDVQQPRLQFVGGHLQRRQGSAATPASVTVTLALMSVNNMPAHTQHKWLV